MTYDIHIHTYYIHVYSMYVFLLYYIMYPVHISQYVYSPQIPCNT